MTTQRNWYRVLLICGLLILGLVTFSVWRVWRQTRLDQDLIMAVRRRDVFGARVLLKQGANPNVHHFPLEPLSFRQFLRNGLRLGLNTHKYAPPALIMAVWGVPGEDIPVENIPLVQALLDNGAAVDAKDEYGVTALMSAAISGHVETVKLLLKHGADTRPKDKASTITLGGLGGAHQVPIAGRNALQYAFEMQEDVVIMEILLDHGADVNVRDGYNGTLLISAAGESADNKVRTLLSHKADVTPRDRWGRTALMQAKGNPAITQLLRCAGARE